jgi:two-component system cell cycle sensor histidine kinase/response regulator CckA
MERFDFQELVERLPLVVYVDALDELSSPRYVSPQIERLLGYAPEEWLADPEMFLRSVHPDDRERIAADIAQRNESGTATATDEYRVIARDGSVVWIRDDEIVVPGADGRPRAAHGYLQDVTERRNDQARLELLVGILSAADSGVSPEEIVANAAGKLADLVGDVTVTYAECDPTGRVLTVRHSTAEGGVPEIWPQEAWAPAYVDRLREGVPIVVEDVREEEWLAPVLGRLLERRVVSFVDVPLIRHGQFAGVLWFNSEQPRTWSSSDVTTLADVAGQLAVIVANARGRQELRRRDAILQAVSHGAERLLAAPSWRHVADELLGRLAIAAETSRAYVFEGGFRADGKRVASQRFEWVAPGISRELDNPVMQALSFEEVGLGRFEEYSLRNEMFSGNVRDFAPEERELFEAQNIRSLLTVPIFVAGEWWGFIGFDDCVAEREWGPAETDALRTAASLVAAAIERERAELVLRDHEQKLRAVFDTALDAIFITDDDRRYVDANPAGCEYIGVSKDDLIGRRIDEFMPPHALADLVRDWSTYLAGGPVLEEWEMQRPDGSVRVAEASARPHFLPGLHIAFLRDITDRKQLEAELLSSQKLESLGRLAGGVAHDFNNLLTGIGGYAALLLERSDGDEELRHDAGEIKRAADRAAELTRQLLAVGRRQVLKPRPLDLNASLAEVGSLLRRVLGADVELELRPGPGLGTVHADPGQIEQVILNLAVNARDAMSEGGLLTIATRNADDGFVELVVADDGAGMDELTKAQIFEPFFTSREDGVGLGLASVYGIVQQSGGDVTVASAPGEGAVFTVRLPRIADPAAATVRTPEPKAAPGSETILLVEDEGVVRDLARLVLERQGYTVLSCSNGAEAVAVAETHAAPIELLLTDIVMPGLRGYEVAEQVTVSRPGINVLYMSGYAEEAFAGHPSVTAATLLQKPFAIDALARRVREALESD